MLDMKSLVLILSGLFFCSSLPTPCDKGPSYWCENEETAQQCGAVSYCENLEALSDQQNEAQKTSPNTAAPVNISMYYESLCPGCRAMLKFQVLPTYQKLKSSGILRLSLYPFGNAREYRRDGQWHFQCQHGKIECDVNIIETCIMHMVPPPENMDFIDCIETGGSYPTVSGCKKCAQELKLEWQPIFNCFNTSQGRYLEHQVAEKTRALRPRHQYVPWLTVNGVHNEKVQRKLMSNMFAFVCDIYTGKKPDVCKQQGEMESGNEKTSTTPTVVEPCYNNSNDEV